MVNIYRNNFCFFPKRYKGLFDIFRCLTNTFQIKSEKNMYGIQVQTEI